MIAVVLVAALQPAQLEWHAPAECPDAEHVRARARRLAVDPSAPIGGRAEVTHDVTGFRLVLAIDGSVEHHVAADCQVLAELTALVVAVAADPVAVAPVVAEAIAPIMTAATPRIHAPIAHVARAPVLPPMGRRRPPWVTVLATHAVAGVAQLPRVDAGLDLALSFERPRFAVQARTAWLFAQRTALPGLAPKQAELSAGNASLRACSMWRWRALAVLGCGGLEAGAIVARPRGVTTSDTVAALWLAGFASAGLRGWVHPRVALELGADLLVALRRPSFALSDALDAKVDAGVGGVRGWAGLAVRLAPRP